MGEFEGKIVIVTGAFSGIGKVIAKQFILKGATVVGTGRNKVNALKLQNEIETKYLNKLKQLNKGKDKDKDEKDTKDKKDTNKINKKDISSVFMYHLGDITKNETIKSVVDLTLNKYGKIDILINNAGMIDRFNTVHNMTDELWEYILKLNLTAPMKLTREVLPHMIKQKSGNIINVGSLGSIFGGRGGVGYVSSKHRTFSD